MRLKNSLLAYKAVEFKGYPFGLLVKISCSRNESSSKEMALASSAALLVSSNGAGCPHHPWFAEKTEIKLLLSSEVRKKF